MINHQKTKTNLKYMFQRRNTIMNNGMSKAQGGFTLIELIIVIVLIGILAVTAGPKLISITAKASAATIDGATGALKSAMNIAYGTAASENKQSNSTATVTVDGASVDVVYGYPKGSAASLKAFTDLDDFTVDETSVGDGKTVSIRPTGVEYTATAADACEVLYTQAASAKAKPTITKNTNGCK